jgi:hypothetical protein
MIGTPVQTIIRVFPKVNGYFNGPGEQYYELTGLPWAEQQAIRNELDMQGFYTQDIVLSDPMPVQVGMEIRKRYEAEQEQKK